MAFRDGIDAGYRLQPVNGDQQFAVVDLRDGDEVAFVIRSNVHFWRAVDGFGNAFADDPAFTTRAAAADYAWRILVADR